MTAGQRAAGRLFMRVGQAGRAAEAHVDRHTMPLFPLPVIMDAEGTLAADARHLARGSDAQTSHAAAARVREFAGHHEKLIAAYLAASIQGGTKDEIAAGTGLQAIAVARRIAAMREHAGVYDSGATRKTPSGRAATVWKIR